MVYIIDQLEIAGNRAFNVIQPEVPQSSKAGDEWLVFTYIL
jgi:hypothetical protein